MVPSGATSTGRRSEAAPATTQPAGRVAAVVVDYDAGAALAACVSSLRSEGAAEIVIVENGDPGPARAALAGERTANDVNMVVPGRNIGYGAGANRGIAASGDTDYVLVCNPDLLVHPGALADLVAVLDERPAWAIVGPRILDPAGKVYPSVRVFPTMTDAAGHALLGAVKPENRFTRRYRSPNRELEGVALADWVSGACFLGRRQALEELGGFDESYFMFAEDMDLCWRAHRAGWGVGVQPAAVVTHTEGVSRRQHPYRMLVAHHRSALRFASRTTRGWRRAALPLAALVLGARLAVACSAQAFHR